MSLDTQKIINGNIITPYRIIRGGSLLIRNGKIVEVSARNIDAPDAVEVDVQGRYVAPGFIDIHVHGGGGHDFMDSTVEAFLGVAETHARFGTTSLVPTTLTAGKNELLHTLAVYEKADAQNELGAAFLGMHIEGPYFSMEQRGAQDPRYIRDPDPEEYMEILNASSSIKRWSVAPERNGAMEFGQVLRSRGILPSIAHTNAVYDDVVRAIEHGYTLATHFYSGMSGVTRRDAFRFGGVIESGYLIDEMDVEIIADGRHLPADLLKLIYKVKGTDRIALITDAMRAAALPPGESMLGSLEDGIRVIVEDGVAKLLDRTAFAGSVATADWLVRTMVNKAEVPLTDAVRMVTATPARIIGVADRKGTVSAGMDADLVIFGEDVAVHATIIGGKTVFERESSTIAI